MKEIRGYKYIPKENSCPPEHTQFGSIEKCPWCDAMRCPKNMPDHITMEHWKKGMAEGMQNARRKVRS